MFAIYIIKIRNGTKNFKYFRSRNDHSCIRDYVTYANHLIQDEGMVWSANIIE